jgi:hypothetical protein
MQKSIKQQYLDLKEGKMTQSNFMRSMRMSLPQYITNVTSFGDTVKILKNKGIISEIRYTPDTEGELDTIAQDAGDYESAVERLEDYGVDVKTAKMIASQFYKVSENTDPGDVDMDAIDAMISDMEQEKAGEEAVAGQYDLEEGDNDIVKQGYDDFQYEIEKNPYSPKSKEFELWNQGWKQAQEEDFGPDYEKDESLNEAKDSSSGYYNQDGKEQISHFKEIDDMNGQEIFAGIKIEHECYPEKSYAEIEKLVIKNIKKVPNYYTNYKLSGIAGAEPKIEGSVKPEDRKMKSVKDGSVVDKAMGMKSVKGFEKAKASSNKAKAETNSGEHVELMTLIAKTVRGIVKMDATGEKGKKIVVREGNEYYQFNGYFKTGEEAKLKSMIPDAEIEVDEEPGQTVKTVVYSNKYNEKTIQQAVENVLGLNKNQPEMGGQGVAKALTKEDIEAMVREVMDETFDGRDNLTDVTGENNL